MQMFTVFIKEETSIPYYSFMCMVNTYAILIQIIKIYIKVSVTDIMKHPIYLVS